MRIRFLRDEIYEQGGPRKGPQFPAGFVLDESGVQRALGLVDPPSQEWARAFLNRWVQRKVAEEVDGRTHPTDPDSEEDGKEPPDLDALDLDALTRADLDALAAERGVDTVGAHTKADVIAALEKADKIAAGDLEGLTRAELDALAAERGVDITGAGNKSDVIAALQLAAESS